MKYCFTLKGGIWWWVRPLTPHSRKEVFIDQSLEVDDVVQAIKAAKAIVKDLRGKYPSKPHEDFGFKVELFLGTQDNPLWNYRFAKGKARKGFWEKRKALDPKLPGFYEVVLRVFTEPGSPFMEIRKGGLIRHRGFSRRRHGSRAGGI